MIYLITVSLLKIVQACQIKFYANNPAVSFLDDKSRPSTIFPIQNNKRVNLFNRNKNIKGNRSRNRETPEIDHPLRGRLKNSSSQKYLLRREKTIKTEDKLVKGLSKLEKNNTNNPFYS